MTMSRVFHISLNVRRLCPTSASARVIHFSSKNESIRTSNSDKVAFRDLDNVVTRQRLCVLLIRITDEGSQPRPCTQHITAPNYKHQT